MNRPANTTVRFFGNLHSLRRDRGLPPKAELWLPPEGRSGFELARELALPLNRIEGVFCNRVARGLDYLLHPGDRIAFIPTGVPGPHRFMLGIYAAGLEHQHD